MRYRVMREFVLEGKAYKAGELIENVKLEGLVNAGFLQPEIEEAVRDNRERAVGRRLRGSNARGRRAGN